MKKLFTLLFSTITIFALVGCKGADTSSTTSEIAPSSSITNTSSYQDTSSLESSSLISEEDSSSEESSSESELTYYHVRFVNDDDTLLYEVDVLEGESAVYVGDTPTKEGTDTVTYTFKGWDKNYLEVTSDLTIVATYYSVSEDTESGWGPIR